MYSRIKSINKVKINKEIKALIIAIVYLTMVSFILSAASVNVAVIFSYLKSPIVILANLLPIATFITIFYFIFKRLDFAYILCVIPIIAINIANFGKMQILKQPLVFSDVSLIMEGMDQAGHYAIIFSRKLVLGLTLLGIGAIICIVYSMKERRISKLNEEAKTRDKKLLLVAAAMLVLAVPLYKSAAIYDSKEMKPLLDDSVATEKYIARGSIYSFFYSAFNNYYIVMTDDYDEKRMKEKFESYEAVDQIIDCNIITLQLEAFTDLESLANEDLAISSSVYAPFRRMQKEGIYGNLITDIFGGGTVNTERSVFTGFGAPLDVGKNMPSYVKYFRDLGMKTIGGHPGTTWYYEREERNKNLGFDEYFFFEEKIDDVGSDERFFDRIFEDIKNNHDKPLYAGYVSYQGHGPYDETQRVYIGRDNFNDHGEVNAQYYCINNYLYEIKDTIVQLEKLYNRLDEIKKPTYLIIFGDHNPVLGYSDEGYNRLGIDIDSTNPNSSIRRSTTPYLILMNEKAKELYGRDKLGRKGDTISARFLIPYALKEVELNIGNEFMQYSLEIMEKYPVFRQLIESGGKEIMINNKGEYETLKMQDWPKEIKEYIDFIYWYINEKS